MVGLDAARTVLQALEKAQALNKAGALVAQLESEFEGVRQRLITEQRMLGQITRTDGRIGSEELYE